ncbi:rhomboid family intramembrane serine protease [Kitasatospora sp. YST-16]|uniref:rhomboid family intramembrane serine protease n=1 Tax=Kitasatospora sp. YST-16 TaxID=2998080 RepID=UPI0022849F57|nr:rhomboid family intramembrane serine protease [Kitasatospora sp. YST-16]WAL70862.1 rhomboid family intramembrane serine protease [Kitasatospora sp. YST-16]WNW36898.1 rhomboid family intramembrane serine protease [Streptomyces sp. Li-HN-5-13]
MDAAHPAPGAQAPEAAPTCFRHPDRESYVRCTRCDRNACPDCRREAAVGYQCVECVKSGHQGTRQARTAFGGRITARPYATVALIALNVAAYLVELVRPETLDRFGVLGSGVLAPPADYDPATYVPHLSGIAHGEWERLLTGAFLHLGPTTWPMGILHIVFNMYWLWNLGRVVEDRLGVLRFLALYLLSALGSSAMIYWLAPHSLAVGASGAVFGLAGGYWVLSRRQGYDPLGGNQMMITLVLWMVLSAGFASWQGHLGGLLTGLAAGAALGYAPRQQRGLVQAINLTAVLALVAVVAVIATDQLTPIS